jgi:uncharacterized protein with von Willebrand factor type A (vWA) domain
MKIKTEPTNSEEKETNVSKDSPNQIKTKIIFEYDQLSFQSEQDLYCLANLTAPTFIQDEDHKRAPIDILCVIDKSGSMYGKKIEVNSKKFLKFLQLVKNSLLFIVQQLKNEDKLGIVTFDAKIFTDFPLSVMTSEGKDSATKAIENIKAGSTTNLSGGIFEALDILESRKTFKLFFF